MEWMAEPGLNVFLLDYPLDFFTSGLFLLIFYFLSNCPFYLMILSYLTTLYSSYNLLLTYNPFFKISFPQTYS